MGRNWFRKAILLRHCASGAFSPDAPKSWSVSPVATPGCEEREDGEGRRQVLCGLLSSVQSACPGGAEVSEGDQLLPVMLDKSDREGEE